MDNKGILTAELIFVTLLLIIVISSLIPLINDRMNTASQTDDLGTARMLAENIAEVVNKAYAGGNGHSVTFIMPENINGKNYAVTVNSTGAYVKIDGMIGKSFTAPHKISSSSALKNEEVTLLKGQNYTVKNVEDSNGYNWIVIVSG